MSRGGGGPRQRPRACRRREMLDNRAEGDSKLRRGAGPHRGQKHPGRPDVQRAGEDRFHKGRPREKRRVRESPGRGGRHQRDHQPGRIGGEVRPRRTGQEKEKRLPEPPPR